MHEEWTLLKRLIWLRRTVGGVTPILKTVKGALLHITDALAKPAHELVAVLEPQQDLHGMPNPYPAGASVNLIPDGTDTENGYVAGHNILVDGSLNIAANWYVSEYFEVDENTTYTWSNRINTNVGVSICFYDENKEFISGVAINGQYSQTFAPPAGAVYARSSQTIYAFQIANPTGAAYQLEVGSTATEYRRYSNICPISGWAECNAYVAGGNLYDASSATNGYIRVTDGTKQNSSVSKVTDYIPVNFSMSFYLTMGNYDSGTERVIGFYNANKSYIAHIIYKTVPLQFVIPNNAAYMRVTIRKTASNVAIEEINTLHIAFTDPITGDPLTVYGGTFTLNEDGSADIVANKASKTYIGDASESWAKFGSGSASAFAMRCPLPNFINRDGSIIANYLKTIGKDSTWGNSDNWVSWAVSDVLITGIKSITTVDAWKAYLAENPLTIVYDLRSSLSYHLDNVGQLVTFLGTNNIWVDASDDLTLTYYADGNVSDAEALNTLLGGMYSPGGDVSDREALNILLGN